MPISRIFACLRPAVAEDSPRVSSSAESASRAAQAPAAAEQSPDIIRAFATPRRPTSPVANTLQFFSERRQRHERGYHLMRKFIGQSTPAEIESRARNFLGRDAAACDQAEARALVERLSFGSPEDVVTAAVYVLPKITDRRVFNDAYRQLNLRHWNLATTESRPAVLPCEFEQIGKSLAENLQWVRGSDTRSCEMHTLYDALRNSRMFKRPAIEKAMWDVHDDLVAQTAERQASLRDRYFAQTRAE